MHGALGAFGIGEQPILVGKIDEIVLRHRPDVVQLAQDELGQRDLRLHNLLLRALWCHVLLHRWLRCRDRQHIRHAPMFSLEQLDHRAKLRLQVRDATFALDLQLLDHFLELSISAADLLFDKSCTLLQVIPDVTHAPLPALPQRNRRAVA